jgi:hypothetical protein
MFVCVCVPSHGQLMLWGIDELLTYHYFIAEYFQTAPGRCMCVRVCVCV